ncbi:MAG: hypothetical protein ACKO2F_11160, partial [Cyanobacteriota bacterium]
RRRAVTVLQERYRASERFICRVVGQHRSTQRHGGKVASIEEANLRHRLREIAAEHIRWGRRMAYRLLRREEGLQRPTPRKRKRARPADGSVRRHRAEVPHQVWAMDFQFDATADGRRLKFLSMGNKLLADQDISSGLRASQMGRAAGSTFDRISPSTI